MFFTISLNIYINHLDGGEFDLYRCSKEVTKATIDPFAES